LDYTASYEDEIRSRFVSIFTRYNYNMGHVFIPHIRTMKPGQTFVIYQGKCPVDANRKGNTGLGDVDLSTGEGLTDKCASVYTFRLVNKCLPEDSSLLCNVRPKCILKKDNFHCKDCDETECSNMVEHIKVFAEFTDAIKVKLLFLNFGGRTTEKIGAALVEQQIMAKENVLSTGYHMCMLIKRQRSKNWLPAQQQCDVTNFVKKVDSFLTSHFDIESGTILTACINDNRMKFVVEIDEET